MKSLIFISIIFVVLIVFGAIYIQWETKNFVEGLPKPPPASDASEETQQVSSDTVPNTVKEAEQLRSKTEPSRLPIDNDSALSETDTSSQKTVTPEVPSEENVVRQHNNYDWREPDIRSHVPSRQIDPWQSAEAGKARGAEVPDITPEQLRSQLVEKFGDIPQVHTFVELRQKTKRGDSLTFDETLLYVESMNHLFPSGKTTEAIRTLKRIREMYPDVNVIRSQED